MGRTHRRLGGSGAPEASVSQLRAQARPFPPPREPPRPELTPAHAIRDRVPQLAETTKRRELLKVVAERTSSRGAAT